MGKPDAPVTVIEFSDYQCPFCQRFFANTLPALKKDYIDTGKVRYVFRDFPLDSIHPQARKPRRPTALASRASTPRP
jgi:protein-disulfide isomerase